MVKSRKLAKYSFLFLLVTIIIAVASSIGMTATWFSTINQGGGIEFGVVSVDIGKTGESECLQIIPDNKECFMPGDFIATVKVGFINNSTIAIKYGYEFALEIKSGSTDISEYFEINGGENYAFGVLQAGEVAPTIDDLEIYAKGGEFVGNELNGARFNVSMSLKVYAIQDSGTDYIQDLDALKREFL